MIHSNRDGRLHASGETADGLRGPPKFVVAGVILLELEPQMKQVGRPVDDIHNALLRKIVKYPSAADVISPPAFLLRVSRVHADI